jgi:hypothetical protein
MNTQDSQDLQESRDSQESSLGRQIAWFVAKNVVATMAITLLTATTILMGPLAVGVGVVEIVRRRVVGRGRGRAR